VSLALWSQQKREFLHARHALCANLRVWAQYMRVPPLFSAACPARASALSFPGVSLWALAHWIFAVTPSLKRRSIWYAIRLAWLCPGPAPWQRAMALVESECTVTYHMVSGKPSCRSFNGSGFCIKGCLVGAYSCTPLVYYGILRMLVVGIVAKHQVISDEWIPSVHS